MKPLADLIPQEESRAVAVRLLDPYLNDPPENGNDEPTLTAILALSEFDLDRAVAQLKNGDFREDDRLFPLVREYVAAKLAEKDSARALAMVESIPDPAAKLSAITRVAKSIPASERGRKKAVLERATTLLGKNAQRANDFDRLRIVSAIAEQWLDIGERDRARRRARAGEVVDQRVPHGLSGPTRAA